MIGTILEKIIEAKRVRIAKAKQLADVNALIAKVKGVQLPLRQFRFRDSISKRSRINIIAEFKRASPSKGVINDRIDPVETAVSYEKAGAAAISVLTEEDFFRGSLDDLRKVRNAVGLPLLRKDFIIDEYQIYESFFAGADAVLLIVAALAPETLKRFQTLACSLGMDALVEVHNQEEIGIAVETGADIIGVNNRNLKTFEVSLNVSRELAEFKPENAIMVAESGLKTPEEIFELNDLGYDAFLIGETLMRNGDIREELAKLAREVAEPVN